MWRLLIVVAVAGCSSGIGAPVNGKKIEKKVKKKGVSPEILPGFTRVEVPPFVVMGDETPDRVKLRAKNTVKWATTHLKKRYFPKDPDKKITIWLFKNKQSYRYYAKRLFNDEPDTPFGYYSPDHNALVMNIATGGGTLVHEMVHPFMSANFPGVPDWFNEGLASLYEQCGERNGIIYGYTNWRLPGLQETIKAGKLPTFKTLTHTTRHQFYVEDPGSNYGQARYLCYYLQERGLLKKYYDTFLKNRQKDPTGYNTLKQILGVKSEAEMVIFQKKWERYVLTLRFEQ